MSPTTETISPEKDVEVEIVEKFDNEVEGTSLSLKELTDLVLDHPKVKQGIVILITDNDDYARFKGHFYDNASLLSGILKDYKAKIY